MPPTPRRLGVGPRTGADQAAEPDPGTGSVGVRPPRSGSPSVLALAAPALVVLAAEPLYLLVDTAVVGNLGTVALGGLAVGGGLLAWAAALLNFLAYGTTARAARRAGAGDRAGAVEEGVQATWLALALGVLVLALFQLLAGPLTRVLAGGAGPVAEAGEGWLRVASLGAPLLLVSLAGNGWLRGVQELRRPVRYVVAGSLLSLVLCPLLVHPVGLGLVGSAVANVAGQALTAALFVRALLREGADWGAHPRAIVRQLVIGRDLLLRAAVLQLSFLVAAGVAARAGTAALGAHQIALQLFFFLALVLDAYAIAAQTLVGHALGAGRPDEARATARRVVGWGLATGCLVAAVLIALRDVLPPLFTDDPAVLAQAALVWWFLACFQPLAGVVFALDGVLMGAGDVGYLRTVTIAAALVGFLPLSLLAGPLDLGLAGIWTGLTLFIVLRLVAVLVRVAGDRWVGAPETVAP
ncbi:MATE family efflux transporter [Blastococcus sp. SYSU DS0510]